MIRFDEIALNQIIKHQVRLEQMRLEIRDYLKSDTVCEAQGWAVRCRGRGQRCCSVSGSEDTSGMTWRPNTNSTVTTTTTTSVINNKRIKHNYCHVNAAEIKVSLYNKGTVFYHELTWEMLRPVSINQLLNNC